VIGYRADSSACWYYRIHLPLSFLTKRHPEYEIHIYSYMDKRHFGNFDLAILQRQYRPEVLEPTLELKRQGAKLVYEIDDDLFHVPKWSVAHKVLGKKSVTEYMKKFLETVDAVFVTTEYLKEVYSPYNENIFVLPNSIAFDAYNPMPRNSSKRVVCWQGSATHAKDIKIIEKAVQRIAKEQQHFVKMWSANIPGTYEVPFVEFRNFYQMLSQMDADVGLAPLVPNMFNRSKSNLKFLEYAAQGVACVASDFGPYQTIEHEETGLLIQDNRNWYDAIMYLLEDDEARNQIIENAFNFVMENYNLADNYILWKQAMEQVIHGGEQK
jgi:glycosyltransferase involved in cell wall biosynthesis